MHRSSPADRSGKRPGRHLPARPYSYRSSWTGLRRGGTQVLVTRSSCRFLFIILGVDCRVIMELGWPVTGSPLSGRIFMPIPTEPIGSIPRPQYLLDGFGDL